MMDKDELNMEVKVDSCQMFITQVPLIWANRKESQFATYTDTWGFQKDDFPKLRKIKR